LKRGKPMRNRIILAILLMTFAGPVVYAQAQQEGKGQVVEEIIARVNNSVITLSDYQKAAAALKEEVPQDCTGCTDQRIKDMFEEREKGLLRDLIDQQLLIQKAKDLDIAVETELVKKLDEIRLQYNLGSMEELEKTVEQQGISWEDYKSKLRDTLLTQELMRREVGSRIIIGHDDVAKYYEEHKTEFNRPEQVVLEEIFLDTQGKTPAQIAEAQKKAEDLLARLKKGEDFETLAKRNSEGQTAKQGGQLGVYERGQLSKEIEDVVFSLKKGELSGVIQTKTGFEILKVYGHNAAGLQPLDKVEGEITNRIYQARVDPALRDYLAELREESYITVKPGFTDTAAVAGTGSFQEVNGTADDSTTPTKTKKTKKKSSS
jgi:peptidyl-prolyl cis-trans isomerase SurA